MSQRLAGKGIIITGGGSGIGEASARLFAAEGARVLCADLLGEQATRVADGIRQAGGEGFACQADVRRNEDVERMVDTGLQSLGRIDVLFNVAGLGVRASVHELKEEDWDLVLDTNLKSVFLCSKAVLPHFLAQSSGNIINTASTFGLLASPRYPAYCASKAGVLLLTKQMALDYGPNIRVNCICPGATDTPRMRRNMVNSGDPAGYEKRVSELNRAMGRLAQPSEIAYAALFLASDESSFVTGEHLVVDGGQTIDA